MDGTTPAFASRQLQPDPFGQDQSASSGVNDFGAENTAPVNSVPVTNPSSITTHPGVEVTVEDLVFLNVPLSWQEAAAVVVELASVAPAGALWPDPAHAVLTESGAIVPALQVTLGGNPVCHAAALLERLLALTRLAPAELKVLVNKNVNEPPAHPSIESFRKALNYFTRPSRLDDSAAVHGRAADLLQKRLLEREFDRVRHKSVRADAEESNSHRWFLLRQIRPEVVQYTLVVLLCLLLLSSGTALVLMAMWGEPLSWSRSSPPVKRPVATAAQADSSTQRREMASSPAPAAVAGPRRASPGRPSATTPVAAVSEATRMQRPAPEVSPALPSGLPAAPPTTVARSVLPTGDAARDRFWSVTLREMTPETTFAVPRSSSPAPDRSPELFSVTDLDVEPAALMRPQLPSARIPSGPDQRDSVFDLIIDQNGRVERVHLVSPGNRFNDRMLIAAAKAWQFLPATRQGQPVRYKLQLRIAP
jgi:hypothetical protein